jgi:hypothetical protein
LGGEIHRVSVLKWVERQMRGVSPLRFAPVEMTFL